MTYTKTIDIGQQLKALQRKASELNWILYTTGYDCGVEAARNAINLFKADTDNYRFILHGLDTTTDSLERRRLIIAERAFRPFHQSPRARELKDRIDVITNRVTGVMNKFRPEFEGRQTTTIEIAKLLSECTNRARRQKAYESQKPVNGHLIEAGFLELVKLRHEFAQACGFDDFVSFSLEADELPATLFADWPAQVAQARPHVERTERDLAERLLNDTSLQPWDLRFVRAQLSPALNHPIDPLAILKKTEDFFRTFGIDTTTMNITFDLFSRRNKSEWGYNFPISPREDTRILMNVAGQYHDYSVMLHETAHAIHSNHMSPDDHWLNAGISGIVSEGFANCFGDLAMRPEVATMLAPDLSAQQLNSLRLTKQFKSLITLNFSIVNTLFDHAIYHRLPTTQQQLTDLFWEVNSQMTGKELWADEPVWGTTIHFTTHPIYFHNYVLGDVMAEALMQVFLRKSGHADILEHRTDFAEFLLASIITPLGTQPILERFKEISGEETLPLSYLLA